MKGAVTWFADNHVAANLLMIFFLLAGAVTAFSIKVEVFPDTALDRISITATYSGASPSEIEESVVKRIEDNIAGLTGIKRIDSIAREGVGTVTIEVMKGWDLQKLLDEVKAEVDRISTFPEDVEKPVVREVTRVRQVIDIAVYGDASESVIKHLAENLKDDLTNLPGITMADLSSVRQRQIYIEISEKTLQKYNLSFGQVAEAVKKASLDLPAGLVKTDGGEILIRTKGTKYRAEDYQDVAVITRDDGSQIKLKHIAKVYDGFEDIELAAQFNGKNAAMIQVYRVADQNALTVANTVKQFIDQVRPTLPAGISIDFYRDMSRILKSRLNLLLKNMAIGLVLVVIMLGLFLNFRLSFWVTLGIPISFMFGLSLLPWLDVSINMISLFAFIMVLGIVVDDAIIVGENIFQKHESGLSALPASVEGTMEVGIPVIFSILTTIAAFWPLLMGGGFMGRIMQNIPIVIIVVLIGSLVESLFILPCHLNGKKLDNTKGNNRQNGSSELLKRFINGPYTKLLGLCVRWRYIMAAISIMLIVIIVGLWQAGVLKFIFFQKVEGDTLRCYITMPSGTPVQRTREVVAHMEQSALKMLEELDAKRPQNEPSVKEYSMNLVGAQFGRGGGGNRGGHVAQIWIQLIEGEKRGIGTAELTRMWRKKAGQIPDAESITFRSEIHRAGNPVEIHLSMADDEQLLLVADELKAELKNYPGVFDIEDSFVAGKKEMQINLKSIARSLGLTLSDLAQQVRHAFYGAEALRLQRDQDEIKVVVRYPENERKSLGNIEKMRIRIPGGSVGSTELPFSQVAEVKMNQGYAQIQRAQRRRVIKVTADVDEAIINSNEVRNTLLQGFIPELQNRYSGLRYKLEGEGREQKESFADIEEAAIIAFFCIYALLAIPFKSFSQPFIVMSAIPFGLIGAAIGHLIMGFNISFLSILGMVGLSGVVVNDSLVLIYRTNRLRKQGNSAYEAITQAGPMRFRAIILTSLTTFAGLTPMLLERSIQAKFLIPMAISLGFGVLFATMVTLLLVPCSYMILDDIHNIIKAIFDSETVESMDVK